MYYIGVADGNKEKWKKMDKINLSILVFCPTIYLATLKVYKKFEDSSSYRSRGIGNRKFEKEKWTNKENGKHHEAESLLHNATSHTHHLYKVQNPRCSCFWEIFDTNLPTYYIGVRDRKNGKRRQILISGTWFFPTIYLATLKAYTKFEDFGSHRSWEICDGNFY